MDACRRMVVGITGATRIIYGVRLLEVLRALGVETHLVVLKAGDMTRAIGRVATELRHEAAWGSSTR